MVHEGCCKPLFSTNYAIVPIIAIVVLNFVTLVSIII